MFDKLVINIGIALATWSSELLSTNIVTSSNTTNLTGWLSMARELHMMLGNLHATYTMVPCRISCTQNTSWWAHLEGRRHTDCHPRPLEIQETTRLRVADSKPRIQNNSMLNHSSWLGMNRKYLFDHRWSLIRVWNDWLSIIFNANWQITHSWC